MEEGTEELRIERRGRECSVGETRKGRKPKLDKKVEGNLYRRDSAIKSGECIFKKIEFLDLREGMTREQLL